MPPFDTWTRTFARLAAVTVAILSMVSVPATGSAAGSEGARNLYFRVGFAIERSLGTRFMDRDCSAPRPGHFYGCTADGAPHGSSGDFGTMHGVTLGVGYFTTPTVRLEAEVQYRPSSSFEGHHSYRRTPPRSTSASLSSLSAMISGYVDLPRLGVSRLGPVRPFFGGGIGLARITIDETRLDFPLTVAKLPRGHRTNLVWMMTAGVAIPLGVKTTLDAALRYTDSGTVETGRGTGRTVCRTEGCTLASDYPVPETRANLSSLGLHVSVRRAF